MKEINKKKRLNICLKTRSDDQTFFFATLEEAIKFSIGRTHEIFTLFQLNNKTKKKEYIGYVENGNIYRKNNGYLSKLFNRVYSGEITFDELLNIIKRDTIKEKRVRMFTDDAIGSSKHEGLEDPYGFHWETLYWYGMDEITKDEYLRLHEEYWMAEQRMKGEEATPIIKKDAEAPLESSRSKELFKKWFINGLINTKAVSLYEEHKENR